MVIQKPVENWFIKGRKIRIAIIGYGRVAKSHIQAIQQYPDELELVALCDVNLEHIKPICQENNIKAYQYIEDLALDPEIDIVTLCTPSGLHPKQAIILAKGKKHIISEKPMATRYQDGLEMVHACDEEGVRLFVVKQNRFNPPIQLLKKAMQEGRFGRVYMADLNVFWHRPQAYYNLASWRGTWEFDGGALMNQASHYIDLLRWVLGPVESVQAMAATLARPVETEDAAVLNIKWRNGALGSVSVTTLVHDKDVEGSMSIIGEKGRVKIGGVALNKIETWEFAERHVMDEQIHDVGYETDSVYGFGHIPYYKNIIDVFHGHAEPLTDGREGLKSLEILTAAYRAAKTGHTVHLPLNVLG